jgi:hypothetical protein
MQRDEFDILLDEEIEKIQLCQKNNNLDSCLPCENLIGCETRNRYVNTVYKSMNKNKESGFDF